MVKLTESNVYIQRKNQIFEQAELIKEEKKKLQIKLIEKGKTKAKRTTGMQVPKYIQSSKHIMAEKKVAQANLGGDKK